MVTTFPVLMRLASIGGMIPEASKDYLVSAFFAFSILILFIFLHLLGSRMFYRSVESGRSGTFLFWLSMLAPGIAGALVGSLLPQRSPALAIGLASGVFLWTAIGDVPEKLGWVSALSRSAVPLFLPSLALWLAFAFLIEGVPVALKGATGYPICVWGLHLTRVRVLSKWGASSLAATIMALLFAMIAGAGMTVGILLKTPLSGIMGGVVFAMATWSTLEINWERGMTKRPWRVDSDQ